MPREYRRPFVIDQGVDVFKVTPFRGFTARKFDSYLFTVAENGFSVDISLPKATVLSLVWWLIKELL